MLLAMRLMLGVGESVMAPAYSKILGFNLPEHHRGFANGVLQAAARSRPAVATCKASFRPKRNMRRIYKDTDDYSFVPFTNVCRIEVTFVFRP